MENATKEYSKPYLLIHCRVGDRVASVRCQRALGEMAARSTPVGLGEVEHAAVLDRVHGRADGAPCQAKTTAVQGSKKKGGKGWGWWLVMWRVF